MEGRRTTRNRPKRTEEVTPQPSKRSSPSRRASPGRATRRSSRPHSTVLGQSASSTTIVLTTAVDAPSPIKEVKESPKSSPKTRTQIPIPRSVPNLSLRSPPVKSATSSSVHSAYSSSTQKTIEIRSTASAIDTEIAKLTDYIRRSVSKTNTGAGGREATHTPTTNTEVESRYSRSVSRSVYDDDNYSKAEFSDNEHNGRDESEKPDDDFVEGEEHYKSFTTTQHSFSTTALDGQACRQLEVPREFGGWFGATALMLLIPTLVYYLQWTCSGENAVACTFKMPKSNWAFDSKYLVNTVFRTDAVTAFVFFNVSVFVLSGVLFGKRVRLPTDLRHSVEYTFNALPMMVLIFLAFEVSERYGFSLIDFVLERYLHFCIYGFVYAFVSALWSYIRVDMLKTQIPAQFNLYGKSGNFIIDYALGRHINPKWLHMIDLKQAYYRASLLLTFIYAYCLCNRSMHIPELSAGGLELGIDALPAIARYYYDNIKIDSTAFLASSLLLSYIGDAIIFEHHLASSFELQGEGFGCLLLLRYSATPYLLGSVAKYFYDNPETPFGCQYALYVAIVVLIVGLFLKRISSAIKYKYRINPTHPAFNRFETIHTFQGRRLLLGGFWGQVRQPNYAGDIIALIGLCVPLFLRFAWPPLISLLMLVILLLHRAQRVNVRNASRYHSSWVRYRNKVRYYIVPKVY